MIYGEMQEHTLKIWNSVCQKIIDADIVAKLKENIHLKSILSSEDLHEDERDEINKSIFLKMSKSELPYFDNLFLEKNWLTRLGFELLSGVGKIVKPEQ